MAVRSFYTFLLFFSTGLNGAQQLGAGKRVRFFALRGRCGIPASCSRAEQGSRSFSDHLSKLAWSLPGPSNIPLKGLSLPVRVAYQLRTGDGYEYIQPEERIATVPHRLVPLPSKL